MGGNLFDVKHFQLVRVKDTFDCAE